MTRSRRSTQSVYFSAGLLAVQRATMATRRDGRTANQIRPLAAEQGILNRADGSARFVQGNTSVLAAVYGPAPAKTMRLERAEGATVDVNFKPESGVSSPADSEREALLRRSLEEVVLRSRYPRAVVSVVIQVRNGGADAVPPRVRRVSVLAVLQRTRWSGTETHT